MLIYDLEILNPILGRDDERQEGIEYCDGWHDHGGMGISVLGVYDYVKDSYRVFCKDNLPDFNELARKHDVLCGFNNLRFDNQVLASNGISLDERRCYDLFIEVQRGLGLDFNNPAQRRTGYNLQSLAYANFRVSKTGKGADAPVHWQRGRIGSVVDYCLADVHLTKKLLDRVIRCGALTDPLNEREPVSIRKPGATQ